MESTDHQSTPQPLQQCHQCDQQVLHLLYLRRVDIRSQQQIIMVTLQQTQAQILSYMRPSNVNFCRFPYCINNVLQLSS